jgi:saccharopine dehydrogenase-like NADP-dependent oxidoreductase
MINIRYEDDKSVEAKLCEFLSINPDGEVMKKLVWLGIFEKKAIGLKNATPAQVLQLLLEQKWKLNPGDKDMIAMYHYFEYEKDGKQHRLSSHMISIGLDPIYTGMARTVGLPIAIYATHLLKGECKLTGVHLPTIPEIYTPILNELAAMGIVFLEKELK